MFILMFFVIQATIWTVAISITSQDMSHAVVAGYDEHALSWDEIKETRQQSAALGWTSEIGVANDSDIRGFREMTIQVTDKDGHKVENAELLVRAFHRGAAAETQDLRFVETVPGTYTTQLRVTRFGTWCFSGTAIQGKHQFLIEQTLDVLTDDTK